MEVREEFRREGDALLQQMSSIQADLSKLDSWPGCSQYQDKPTAVALLGVITTYAETGVLLASLLASPHYDSVVASIWKIVQTGNEYNQLYNILNGQFEPAIFEYSFEQAKLRWKQAATSWFLPRMTVQNKLVKELKLYAKNTSAITKETICGFYKQLSVLIAKKRLE